MSTPPVEKSGAARGAGSAAQRWRLPFSRQAWRGYAGNWLGVGAGSSLDFQDHRNYMPGDDPRHIHWQAYARTGSLTMKLYRAEVAPFVDIAVDVSGSMALTPAKADRTDELVAFCVASADRSAAPSRVHAMSGRRLQSVALEDVRAGTWRRRLQPESGAGVAPGPMAWRARAMKVLISDLLYPGDPATIVTQLAAGAGIAIVLAPALTEEATLEARGNIELADCEVTALRRQRIDDGLAGRYAAAYDRHFTLWREACRRRGVLFARIPCEGDLVQALAAEARASGAVEPVN